MTKYIFKIRVLYFTNVRQIGKYLQINIKETDAFRTQKLTWCAGLKFKLSS